MINHVTLTTNISSILQYWNLLVFLLFFFFSFSLFRVFVWNQILRLGFNKLTITSTITETFDYKMLLNPNWIGCWYNSHFWCILSHSSELSSIGIHVPPVSIRCSVRLIRVRVLRPRSGVLLVLCVVIIWPRRRVIISITVGGRCHTCLRVGEWPYAIQCGVPADTTLDWTHWSACTRARSRAGGSRGRCWGRHGIVYWRWGWGRRWTATSLRTCREALSWAYSGTCWRQLGRRRRRRRRGRWRSAAADVTSGKALVWFVAW